MSSDLYPTNRNNKDFLNKSVEFVIHESRQWILYGLGSIEFFLKIKDFLSN